MYSTTGNTMIFKAITKEISIINNIILMVCQWFNGQLERYQLTLMYVNIYIYIYVEYIYMYIYIYVENICRTYVYVCK